MSIWRSARRALAFSHWPGRAIVTQPKHSTFLESHHEKSRLGHHVHSRHHSYVTSEVARNIIYAQRNDEFITVAWADGTKWRYPFIYLRDNCQCEECYHEGSHMRILELASSGISADISPFAVKTITGAVKISWPDGHKSVYSSEWLREHVVSDDPADRALTRFSRPERQLWSAAEFPTSSKFKLDNLLNDERTQYQILRNLCAFGVAIVSGCGTKPMPISVYEKLGILSDNAFGPLWEVKAKPNPSNLAYSTKAFPLHTDQPYMEHVPGILHLHCMEQALTDGHTNLTDGFYAAQQLAKAEPRLYKLLCELPVTWMQKGFDAGAGRHYNYEFEQPIFQVDYMGVLKRICFSIVARSSFLSIDPDLVHDFYRGLIFWTKICQSDEARHAIRLEPGDWLLVDNHRITHGRAAIKDEREQGRCLRGGHFSWDDTLSRMRYLHFSLLQSGEVEDDLFYTPPKPPKKFKRVNYISRKDRGLGLYLP